MFLFGQFQLFEMPFCSGLVGGSGRLRDGGRGGLVDLHETALGGLLQRVLRPGAVKHGLLDAILLAEGIVHVRQLVSARVLVGRHQRVQATLGDRASLQAAGAGAEDVTGGVSLQEGASLSRVEVAEALGVAGTAIDVLRRQRSLHEPLILTGRRQNIGLGAPDLADVADLEVALADLLAVLVHRRERVGDAAGLEDLVRDVTVVQLGTFEGALTLALHMTGLGLAALNATRAEDVLRLVAGMPVLHGPSALDVVDVLLVAEEAGRRRLDEGDALQSVVRVQRISGVTAGRELDAMGLGEVNVVRPELVVGLGGRADVQGTGLRALDVGV